jgi:hypothetical protein
MRRPFNTGIAALLTAALALAAAPAGRAQGAPPSFVPLRITRDARLSREAREAALQGLAAQQPDPQHVVVLVHGWDTPLYASARQYAEVAPRVKAEFDRLGDRVAILGVQWDSDAGPRRAWLPTAFAHYVFGFAGFRNAVRDPYSSRVPVARAAGRLGLRQMLFDIEDRFPNAQVHVFAHSMGAETAIHALDPSFTPFEGRGEPVYLPERPLKLGIVALAGADLDYDAQARTHRGPGDRGVLPSLLWITLPKLGTTKDKVLSIRKRARGKAALGNSVPRLRGDQFDTLISQRCLIMDTIDIPRDHALVEYYASGRLARLADAAVTLRDPARSPSAMLRELDVVLHTPDDVAVIAPHLIGPETSPKVYALWRLEHVMDGGSAHLESGYAERVLAETLKDPAWLDRERQVTDCKVVRAGLWPPVDVVERVRAAAAEKRRRARTEPRDPGFFTQPAPDAPR